MSPIHLPKWGVCLQVLNTLISWYKKEKELGKTQCSGNQAEVGLTAPFFLILRLIIGLKVIGQGCDKWLQWAKAWYKSTVSGEDYGLFPHFSGQLLFRAPLLIRIKTENLLKNGEKQFLMVLLESMDSALLAVYGYFSHANGYHPFLFLLCRNVGARADNPRSSCLSFPTQFHPHYFLWAPECPWNIPMTASSFLDKPNKLGLSNPPGSSGFIPMSGFLIFNFYWHRAALQCSVSFCHEAKWISYMYTYIHFLKDVLPT